MMATLEDTIKKYLSDQLYFQFSGLNTSVHLANRWSKDIAIILEEAGVDPGREIKPQ